jgi:hypothetical protein
VNATGYGLDIDAPYSGNHSGTRICDNLFYEASGTTGVTGTATGLTFDHNLWSSAPGEDCSGTGDVVDDPELADADHAVGAGSCSPDWYKLTASSPARGAGVAHADMTEDYFGTSRSDPPDMGAHEY